MISPKYHTFHTPSAVQPFAARLAAVLLSFAIIASSVQPLGADAKAVPPQKPAASGPAPGKTAQPEKIQSPKNIDELLKLEDRVKKAIAKVLPATVAIRIGSGSGSGVIVSREGYILTAGHVAGKPGRKAKVTLSDGKEVNAVTLGVYRSPDAGMLKITDKITDENTDEKTAQSGWPVAQQGSREDIKLGMWCVVLGHPLGVKKGRPPVVRIGRVLRIQQRTLQTDCPLIGGDSGGPLVDLEGRIIGINSRISGDISMNYHVPIDVFRDNWERLLKGDDWHDDVPKRDSANVKSAFRKVVAKAAKCVVRVKCDGKDTVLGTIVGPDGWILTKASEILIETGELKGRIVCRLRDGRDLEARIVGIDPRFDLAMLKIDATDLPVIPWTMKETPVGNLVAAAGMADEPLAIGVVSVPRRAIPPLRAAIGVVVKDGDKGPIVQAILPKSPADKAGVKKGDAITHVDGKPIKTRKELSAALRRLRAGTKVQLTLLRDGKKIEQTITLKHLVTAATKKRDMLNRTGVGISRRHDDFPLVLQHDTALRPSDCGGPLVRLDGKVVGMNVARGGRTETYCIPAAALVTLMYPLMSGQTRPKAVEKLVTEKPNEKAPPKKAPPEKAPPRKAPPRKAPPKKPEAKKAIPKKAESKKPQPKQPAPKKVEPKKTEPKQSAPKKAEPKKPAPKKAEPKKPEPKQPAPKKPENKNPEPRQPAGK